MRIKNKMIVRLFSALLAVVLLFSIVPTKVEAVGLIEELFGISFYYFHWRDENGKEREDSFYNWGSADAEKNGIKIVKTGDETLKVVIDADANEKYQKCKPVLIWLHKADGLLDATKYTDIDQWYINKLAETFLLCEIPDYTQDCEIVVDVPIKLNLGLTGLINGGYYEIEFYDENSIPEPLKYAYEAQSYTLEELEKYMKYDMSDTIAEYYSADSGFRSEKDGLPFVNVGNNGGGAYCAGFSMITASKYNGYSLPTEFVSLTKAEKIKINPQNSWYSNVYGDDSIHDIRLDCMDVVKNNSPSLNMNSDGSADVYPFKDWPAEFSESDNQFFALVEALHLKNNTKVTILDGKIEDGIKNANLENRWALLDYVTSYLRQGKVVIVNMRSNDGGHAVVGYRTEQIDENTLRMYCYDSNHPDDMRTHRKDGAPADETLDENGAYENYAWFKSEDIYIDFHKETVVGAAGLNNQREYDIFTFESHTSYTGTSSDSDVTFVLAKGDAADVVNYDNEVSEIIAFKAYPVIQSDKTVLIRTFAYYKSGEVVEITNSVNTTVNMDYDFIGWYKIKNSTVTLTKDNYKFDNSGKKYIECYVAYNNKTDSHGAIQVRIPIA